MILPGRTRAAIFAARTQAPGATAFGDEWILSWLKYRRVFAGNCLYRSWLSSFGAIIAPLPLLALRAIFALRAILAGRSFCWLPIIRLAVIGLPLIGLIVAIALSLAVFAAFLAFLPAISARAALLFLADALIGDDAEIVIGELEVILLQHPVPIEVRVVRQLAVLFQHLRGIAARPAVNPVELLPISALTAAVVGVTAAAPTVIVTASIVIQG